MLQNNFLAAMILFSAEIKYKFSSEENQLPWNTKSTCIKIASPPVVTQHVFLYYCFQLSSLTSIEVLMYQNFSDKHSIVIIEIYSDLIYLLTVYICIYIHLDLNTLHVYLDSHCNPIHTCFAKLLCNIQSHFDRWFLVPSESLLDIELKFTKFGKDNIF